MQYTPREPFPQTPEPDDSPVGIVSLWHLLWRNKWRIAAPAVVLSFLTAILVLQSDDIYSADAQVLLTRGTLEIVEFDSAGGFDVTPGAIANALTILGSRSLALQVTERLGLLQDPRINPNLSAEAAGDADAPLYSEAEVRQLALDWLADVTQIAPRPGTNVIVIRTVTTDPALASAVANAYADAYLDYQRSLGRGETERAAEALETRVSELRLQLEEDQQALQDYRGSAQSVTTQSADALAVEAATIRSRLNATENALAELGDTEGAERTRLLQLRAALQQSRESIEARIEEANAFTVGLRQLEVEVETTSQVYEASLARLKELSIQTGLRDAGAQVLARAEPPLRPSAQGRRRMVAIAGVLGLFLGIAWVLLREAANNRVRRGSELAEIAGGAPVVQVPPAAKGLFRPRRVSDRRAAQNGMSPFYEGIRALRQQMLGPVGAQGTGAVVAGVFSALPNEGKSTVTDALARSAAMLGRRVIVIDGDMRTGALSRSLGVEGDAPGLPSVIAENRDPADTIVTVPDVGYDLLSGGPSSLANAADLLESTRLGELIAALRERYDVVLFDTPPVLVVPDAGRIAALLDRHVFVAAFDRSPRPAVRDALAALQDAGVDRPILALVDVPQTFGRQYGVKSSDYARYVG